MFGRKRSPRNVRWRLSLAGLCVIAALFGPPSGHHLECAAASYSVAAHMRTGGGRFAIVGERLLSDRYAVAIAVSPTATFPGLEGRVDGKMYLRPQQRGLFIYGGIGIGHGGTPYLTWWTRSTYLGGGYAFPLSQRLRVPLEAGVMRRTLVGTTPHDTRVTSKTGTATLSIGVQWLF